MQEKKTTKGEVEKSVSLEDIIKRVLDDKGIDVITYESNVRALRRAFIRLFERLGSDLEIYKYNGVIAFTELEVPFMKSLLFQLYDNKGIIADFVNGGKKNKKFSSEDVRKFLELLDEEMAKTESEENKKELEMMRVFFSNLFLYSPLRSVEDCHKLIDTLAMNLEEIPVDRQSFYLGKIEHILKKEVALRIAESTMEKTRIATRMEITKEENNDDNGKEHFYYESDPEIRFHYKQRDKRVLEAIQKDADLRSYIEKKFGKKAEEIFNYAMLDM